MYVFWLDMPIIEIVIVILIMLLVFSLLIIFCLIRIKNLEKFEIKELNELERIVCRRDLNDSNYEKGFQIKESHVTPQSVSPVNKTESENLEGDSSQTNPMIQKARDFVSNAKSKGYAEDVLREAFEKKGWDSEDINLIFQSPLKKFSKI